MLAGPPLAAGGAPAPTTKGQQWKLETVVRTARDREGKEKDGGSGAGGSLPASRDEDEDDVGQRFGVCCSICFYIRI